MTDQALQELLGRLYEELQKVEGADEQQQRLIRDLEAQIHERIRSRHPEQDQPLINRLEEAVIELEASHSELTAVISHVIGTLSNMGF